VRPYIDLLRREKDFRRTYFAQLIALGGDWFALIPLLILLPELTGSGLWGAMLLATDTLVFALVGPYAGTVVDRLDRRRVIVVANTVSGWRRCCSCWCARRRPPGSPCSPSASSRPARRSPSRPGPRRCRTWWTTRTWPSPAS
jgi:hypothetical protein